MKKFENARRLWLIAGYFGCALIAVLSLIPAPSVPRTGLGGSYDHWLAYVAVGFCFGTGFRSLRLQLMSGLAMTLGAMVLELLQNFIPGRTPDFSGFMGSSLGAWSGLAMAILAYAVLKAFRTLPR